MSKLRVGIIGATGMVGQRFALLLANHPWFEIAALAASARSAGRTYEESLQGRWMMKNPIPENLKNVAVQDAADVQAIADQVDLVFCAVNMPKPETRSMEEAFARTETPVFSNNSACRGLPDVPLMLPEVNAAHLEMVEIQKKRLGTKRGFIVVKPNCSIQSYVPALTPLLAYEPEKVMVTTYQAISGAGKTFETFPDILDNVIPYIAGEEEKSEQEPLKLWGSIRNGEIVPAKEPVISAQCLRVPVSDGHMAAAFVKFRKKPSMQEMKEAWAGWETLPNQLGLPSAPKPFLKYMEEPDRPQTKLDRDYENGMGVTIGRLREDAIFDYRFVSLSHNTLRGAAGGNVLTAELAVKMGLVQPK